MLPKYINILQQNRENPTESADLSVYKTTKLEVNNMFILKRCGSEFETMK